MEQSITVCSNEYYFPEEYRISEIENVVIELKNENIVVEKLYYASRYDWNGKMYLEDGFVDIYVFQHKGMSYLIIRYVEDGGLIHKKIIKSKCNMHDVVNLTQYLTSIS